MRALPRNRSRDCSTAWTGYSRRAVAFVSTGSVALLADLIHNVGDALTALPLAVAFLLRSVRATKGAGHFVVATLGLQAADPVIGLVISLVILRITWRSWQTVRADPRM